MQAIHGGAANIRAVNIGANWLCTLSLSVGLGLAGGFVMPAMAAANQTEDLAPLYKPSGRSPQAIDIRLPIYGASRSAPDALSIGDTVADFTIPRAGGGVVALAELRKAGPVAIIFYRGHW